MYTYILYINIVLYSVAYFLYICVTSVGNRDVLYINIHIEIVRTFECVHCTVHIVSFCRCKTIGI